MRIRNGKPVAYLGKSSNWVPAFRLGVFSAHRIDLIVHCGDHICYIPNLQKFKNLFPSGVSHVVWNGFSKRWWLRSERGRIPQWQDDCRADRLAMSDQKI
jgi:hypothetical protein